MSLSTTAIAALFAQNTGLVLCAALEISDSYLSTPFYFVNNRTNVTIGGQIYTAAAFELTLAADEDGTVPQAQIQMDTVDQTIIDLLRSAQDQPAVNVSIVSIDSGGTVRTEAGPIAMSMISYDSLNAQSVKITLGFKNDLLNQAATKDHLSPGLAPGLF